MRQSSRRGNFPRLLFTIDRYVASDYQVLHNLVLHLELSSGLLERSRSGIYRLRGETLWTDILFATSDLLRLLIIFSRMNSLQKFYSILVFQPCMYRKQLWCLYDKLFIRPM